MGESSKSQAEHLNQMLNHLQGSATMGIAHYKTPTFERNERVLDCELAIEPAVAQMIQDAKTSGWSGRDAVLAASLILERLAAEEVAQEIIGRTRPFAA